MFAHPKHIVFALGLYPGMRVADFGAGTGAHAIEASKIVGPAGKVYAIEVRKDMVMKLESELKQEHIENVDCIWGDIEHDGGTKLGDKSVDAIIISNVLFQASDRLGLIDEAKRILKPGGRALVVDWKEAFGRDSRHIVSEEVAEELFKKRGWKIVEKVSSLDHQYGILLKYE